GHRVILINDVRTLTWVAEAGGIEIHPFLHRVPKIDEATHVVFDLDPGPGAMIVECCGVAMILRDALKAVKLESFAKVSGSKGLQVYVPLNSGATHDTTETFARLLAQELARANPKLIVAKMTKSMRAKKVFIDWSQNADYKTTVAVYSLRTKSDTPYVSMPVTWDEVRRAKNLYFEPDEALQRLAKRGDLWSRMESMKQRLGGAPAPPPARKKSPPRAAALHREALPKMKSQSGRRLFVLVKGVAGDELWLDMRGKFKRWILRPDRERRKRLIAMPAGDFAIDPAYFRGEVPAAWKKRIRIEDIGAYEVIEGSYQQRRFELWFSGRTLAGEWELRKIEESEGHRSWQLEPVS
ncbi:MAG TPA: hypothetical protein VLU46_06815, partial [Thermoanaerobaculia bacterium]|nr:hypothetical protein [Thermoanaerobaculia bacterium]